MALPLKPLSLRHRAERDALLLYLRWLHWITLDTKSMQRPWGEPGELETDTLNVRSIFTVKSYLYIHEYSRGREKCIRYIAAGVVKFEY